MIFQLPTKSDRIYRGKYPRRVWSWGYSRSPSQAVIGKFLEVDKPVHLELNDGTRYILSLDETHPALFMMNAEMEEVVIKLPMISKPLSQERYDEMLLLVRKERARK